jgi:iron complex transport system ATP-binding protein
MTDVRHGLSGAETQATALHLDSVSVWAPSGAQLLRDVDWKVDAGQRWALIGPNGSGKSTILSLAGAVRHPSAGRAAVLGGVLGQVDMPRLRRRIGIVDASADSLPWLTGEEAVLTGVTATIRPLWDKYTDAYRERARSLLGLFGCEHTAERELSTCSQGERSRIRIARSLIADPCLLLLDEPAAGLDLAAREALIAALDRLSEDRPRLTSILVTHHVEEIPRSTTHALLLRQGKTVAAGPIRSTLTSDNLSLSFGLPVECEAQDGRYFAKATASWDGAAMSDQEQFNLALVQLHTRP